MLDSVCFHECDKAGVVCLASEDLMTTDDVPPTRDHVGRLRETGESLLHVLDVLLCFTRTQSEPVDIPRSRCHDPVLYEYLCAKTELVPGTRTVFQGGKAPSVVWAVKVSEPQENIRVDQDLHRRSS